MNQGSSLNYIVDEPDVTIDDPHSVLKNYEDNETTSGNCVLVIFLSFFLLFSLFFFLVVADRTAADIHLLQRQFCSNCGWSVIVLSSVTLDRYWQSKAPSLPGANSPEKLWSKLLCSMRYRVLSKRFIRIGSRNGCKLLRGRNRVECVCIVWGWMFCLHFYIKLFYVGYKCLLNNRGLVMFYNDWYMLLDARYIYITWAH